MPLKTFSSRPHKDLRARFVVKFLSVCRKTLFFPSVRLETETSSSFPYTHGPFRRVVLDLRVKTNVLFSIVAFNVDFIS